MFYKESICYDKPILKLNGDVMLCQRCKRNPAEFNYYYKINGLKVESHLCAFCAEELNCGQGTNLSEAVLNELLGRTAKKYKVCDVCGTTFDQYERTGLLGCASCYDVFREELTPIIESIQGKTEHVGKQGQNSTEHDLLQELELLQNQLEAALRDRRYSDAQRIDDKIKVLTKKMNGERNDGSRS